MAAPAQQSRSSSRPIGGWKDGSIPTTLKTRRLLLPIVYKLVGGGVASKSEHEVRELPERSHATPSMEERGATVHQSSTLVERTLAFSPATLLTSSGADLQVRVAGDEPLRRLRTGSDHFGVHPRHRRLGGGCYVTLSGNFVARRVR